KTLLSSGDAGQNLLCTTLLGMLLNGQNITLFPQIRSTLVDSGAMALETTVGLAKELSNSTPSDMAIFAMGDLVEVLMVIIGFGDLGAASLDEFSRSPKPNVRRCVATAI